MIIELPEYVDTETLNCIKNSVYPFIPTKQTYLDNREGKSIYITETPELKEVDNILFNIFTKVQENIIKPRYKIQMPSSDSGYEYHKYEANQVCRFHADGEFTKIHHPNIYKLRYASVVLHLNTIEEGGELIFPNQNQKVKTEAGKIVIFPPYPMFPHYTTPSQQEREVIVTWFTYADIVLTFKN